MLQHPDDFTGRRGYGQHAAGRWDAARRRGGLFDNPIVFLALPGILLFYILFLRPMRKQEQERNALLTSTKKNDKIITHSGIYGTVVSVSEKEDEITMRK